MREVPKRANFMPVVQGETHGAVYGGYPTHVLQSSNPIDFKKRSSIIKHDADVHQQTTMSTQELIDQLRPLTTCDVSFPPPETDPQDLRRIEETRMSIRRIYPWIERSLTC